MVENTARTMANNLFEIYARQNDIYRALRARGEITEKDARTIFIARLIPKLYEEAREYLTSCLAEPDDKVTPYLKEQIYEALILDNPLRGNRLVSGAQATKPPNRETRRRTLH